MKRGCRFASFLRALISAIKKKIASSHAKYVQFLNIFCPSLGGTVLIVALSVALLVPRAFF
jgi:hypothetical protein